TALPLSHRARSADLGRARPGGSGGAHVGTVARRRRAGASHAVVQLLRHLGTATAMSDRPEAFDPTPILGVPVRDIEAVQEAVDGLLPIPLKSIVDTRFSVSHLLFDEYVVRLAIQVVRQVKLEAAIATWATATDAATRAGLDTDSSLVVEWLLRHLAPRGLVTIEIGRGGSPLLLRRERPAAPSA